MEIYATVAAEAANGGRLAVEVAVGVALEWANCRVERFHFFQNCRRRSMRQREKQTKWWMASKKTGYSFNVSNILNIWQLF